MWIESAPLAATAAALRSGQLDLIAYIERLCDRIDRVEPHIGALLPEADRRARLLTAARALGTHFPDPAARPPLYGVPVGVKDIFRVDGFETRAGSQLPPELFAGEQATVVSRLQASGALILGKTVTTEFAFFEPGATRNPHRVEHTPGGSSSGSAAAVAAGLCPLALGTQTIGSIIRPAAYCGVVGFKPSYGRIDRDGLLLISPSLDHIGFFTQDAAGAALAAALLCADWQPAAFERIPVLGVPQGAFLEQASARALVAFEAQIAHLERSGYEIIRLPMLDDIARIDRLHKDLMAAEMAALHANWFARYAALYRPRTAGLIQRGQGVAEAAMTEARAMQLEVRMRLETALTETGIDLWISPPAPDTAPPGLASTGDPLMNLPWTFAGLPTLTLPAGKLDGLPLGLQVTGKFMTDELLLTWAAHLETIL